MEKTRVGEYVDRGSKGSKLCVFSDYEFGYHSIDWNKCLEPPGKIYLTNVYSKSDLPSEQPQAENPHSGGRRTRKNRNQRRRKSSRRLRKSGKSKK
jgi:hypothetical protein